MAASIVLMGRCHTHKQNQILKKIMTFALLYFLKTVVASDVDWGEHLLCRNCGHEVAKAEDLVNKPSPHALHQRNETIMGIDGVLIQIFKNPQGMQFEVLTTRDALVERYGHAYPADSWFDDYTWRLVRCSRCQVHLGWCYEPADHMQAKCPTCHETNKAYMDRMRFFGFIMNKVIHQEYADSLVMSPKFYGG